MPKVSRGPKFRRGAAPAATAAAGVKGTSGGAAPELPESEKRPDGANKTYDDRRLPDVEKKDGAAATSEVLDPPAALSISSPAGGPSSTEQPPLLDASPGGTKGPSSLPRKATNADNEDSTLSRGQRKRQAKKEQYLRKERLVMASLKLKHDDDQKRRIDGLDAIRNALLESVVVGGESGGERKGTRTKTAAGGDPGPHLAANSSSNSSNMLKTNHSKQRLVQREAAQMSLVLQHPAFVEDPFDAIRQHLHNTAASQRRGGVVVVAKKSASETIKTTAISVADGANEDKRRVRRRRHRVKATRSKSRR